MAGTMGNQLDGFTAAIIDDDPRRREWVAREIARLGGDVRASAGHGLVGGQAVYQAAPQYAFVSFEEPYARTTGTITHAAITSRVVVYTSDTAVNTYQAAIRAGAQIVLSSPPQRRELEQALERLQPKKAPPSGSATGQVVVVASAKGGTGKSTIAANLAALLAREHASSVLLVDFATDFGDAGLLLNLGEGTSIGRAARQVARAEIEEFRESLGYHQSGVFVLAAAHRFSERVPIQVQELEALLELSVQSFDHVVIDTAAVFDDTLVLAMGSADLALVPAAPDVLSIANTRRFLRDLEDGGYAADHVLPVLNGISQPGLVAGADAAEVLERKAIWEVPFDRHVLQANQRGIQPPGKRPSPAIRSLRALAGRIALDPTHIERRTSVRPSTSRFDPAFGERLRQMFALSAGTAPPNSAPATEIEVAFVTYSNVASALVYHAESCTVGARIRPENRVTADRGDLPVGMRPCKVCVGAAEAA